MDQLEREQTVLYCPPDQAASLVYMWVKNKVITLKEFKQLCPLIGQQPRSECECGRGVPGNENVFDGNVICDYCHCEQLLKARKCE